MTITFKGSMPAPKHEHGDILLYNGLEGVVHHRRHKHIGNYWEYGLLVAGFPFILWVLEPQCTTQ